MNPSPAYVRGARAAARFLGIGPKAFRSWRDDPTLPKRELLRPRVIRGDAFYSIANLTRFMTPTDEEPTINHRPT